MHATFAALADENRLRIVTLLRDGARAVNDIAESLELNQPHVSKHLGVLKSVGLVEVEPRAQRRLYALRTEPLREVDAWLEDYRSLWEDRFAAMDDLLKTLKPARRSHGTRKKT